MNHFKKLIASCFGIGMIGKGGGTIAAGILSLLWLALMSYSNSKWVFPILTVGILFLGTWASSGVEVSWGKDSSKVVIDEMAGMCISLLFLDCTIVSIFVGFLLFRFFDIVKPFYIKRMELLPGGIGVMMDDVLAGIYTNLLLQIALRIKSF